MSDNSGNDQVISQARQCIPLINKSQKMVNSNFIIYWHETDGWRRCETGKRLKASINKGSSIDVTYRNHL